MTSNNKNVSRKRSRPMTPKKQIKNPLFLIIIVIVLIVVISSLYYIFFMNSDEDNPIAVIDTSMGIIKIELYEDKMPITCNNFIQLASDGFYDSMIFYRILDDFMIQAGRFYPDGTEKFSPYDRIEFEESDFLHVDGAISMASTGAKVGGQAEFFICDGEQQLLDGNYAAFGITIEGIDIVRDIASQPQDNSSPAGGGKPYTDIIINSIKIE
jgi:peptidyl-prolyl cis-trans isomerase B (cyclophilin B)